MVQVASRIPAIISCHSARDPLIVNNIYLSVMYVRFLNISEVITNSNIRLAFNTCAKRKTVCMYLDVKLITGQGGSVHMLAYMVIEPTRTLAETKNGNDERVFCGIAKIIHNQKMWFVLLNNFRVLVDL